MPTVQTLRQQYHSTRDLLARYRLLREDHLRYLVKCGVIQPVVRTNSDTFFAFGDLAIIKQANDDLAGQASFRAVARNLIASRQGQLAFDFRLDAAPAKILTLQRPADRPAAAPRDDDGQRDTALAEQYFRMGSALDDGDESKLEQAAAAYRKALELDPYLVAGLINLANVHYSRDEVVEAQALYERAIGLEPDFFEAHFNLGNIYHDLGRFRRSAVVLSGSAAAQPAVRRRAFLPGRHVREDGAVAGGQAALEGVPGARAARGMGGVGEGVL